MTAEEEARFQAERQLWALFLLSTCRELLKETDHPDANEVRQQIDLWFRGKHAPPA